MGIYTPIDASTLKPITFNSEHATNSKKLNSSVCVPSTMHSYSLATEYMKNWFLSKFTSNTFKSIHIEGKHTLDDFKNLDSVLMLKRPKPSLTIIPLFSWDFNDDQIDSYAFGLNLYAQTGQFRRSFLTDPINNVYMGLGIETHLLQFQFRIRLETRAQQLDMYKYIKLACRVGFSEGKDVNLDFHVPYNIMLQIANDIGFETINDNGKIRIRNISSFLNYLNSHSQLPFLYKHRTVNGNNEFFIRMHNMYVHIKSNDITADDGEREGQINTNYIIELNTEVRFPAPKMYAYYSSNEHSLSTVYSGNDSQAGFDNNLIFTFKGTDVPEVNSKNWLLYLTTSYDEEVVEGQVLTIDFNELFEGDLDLVINKTLEELISPALFLDILLINNSKTITYKMDWETKILTTDSVVEHSNSFIALYCDLGYLNNKLSIIKNDNTNRLEESN